MSGWERAEMTFWMLMNTGSGSAMIYQLATGAEIGWGWAALAGINLLIGLGHLLVLIQERG
jgi:hypothetical protein